MAVPKICGIETEYGIVIRGVEDSNPISASSLLINAYLSALASGRGAGQTPRVDWDFEDETPGNDARGDALRLSMAPEVETLVVEHMTAAWVGLFPEAPTPGIVDARISPVWAKS